MAVNRFRAKERFLGRYKYKSFKGSPVKGYAQILLRRLLQKVGFDPDTALMSIKPTLTVKVGYDEVQAPYATYVHEDLMANHGNPPYRGGKAKFLEDPMKEMKSSGRAAAMLTQLTHDGMSMDEAMVQVGFVLLGESIAQCPRDTGNLQDSGYVEIVK